MGIFVNRSAVVLLVFMSIFAAQHISVAGQAAAGQQNPAAAKQNPPVVQQPVNAEPATPPANYKGPPYPLPQMPESVNAPIKPSSDSLKLDEVTTTAAPPTVPTPPEEGGPAAETASEAPTTMVTPELINFLKKAVQAEQQALLKLGNDIKSLQDELKSVRTEAEEKKKASEKEGLADAVVLELEFPSKQKQAANTSKAPTAPAAGGGTTETTTPAPLVMLIKPIPVIYAEEDSRAEVANAVENVLKTQQEQADIAEGEMAKVAGNTKLSNEEKAKEIQEQLDRLASKKAYFEEDSNAAEHELSIEGQKKAAEQGKQQAGQQGQQQAAQQAHMGT